MFKHNINNVIIILYTLGIVSISLMFMFIIRRSVSISTLESHHTVAGFVYAVVGIIYAVLISFVVLMVWQQFHTAQDRAEKEASAVSILYKTTRSFDSIPKARIQSYLKEYCFTMIEYEYPAMNELRSSSENFNAYKKLWDFVVNYKPQTQQELLWYKKLQDGMINLQESRRLRLNAVNFAIPQFMWYIIFIGAVITISFAYLFGTKTVLPQALMMVALSMMIGLVLLLVSALENPFSGIIRVDSEPFVSVLKNL